MKTVLILSLTATMLFFLTVFAGVSWGSLTFGYGLGDIVFVFAHLFWILLLGIFAIVIYRRSEPFDRLFSASASVVMLMSIFLSIRSFTVDRGAEYPWNGRVFMLTAEEARKVRNQRIEEERSIADRRSTLDSNDVGFVVKTAQMYSESSRWSKAIDEYEKALAIDSANFDALYGLGETYLVIKHHAHAIELFEKARDVDSIRNGVSAMLDSLKETLSDSGKPVPGHDSTS